MFLTQAHRAICDAHLERDEKMNALRRKWLAEFQKVLPGGLAARASVAGHPDGDLGAHSAGPLRRVVPQRGAFLLEMLPLIVQAGSDAHQA